MCACSLARAHARSGDRIAIAAYLGSSDAFDRAIAEFSEAYADQNERDYDALVQAEKDGRITPSAASDRTWTPPVRHRTSGLADRVPALARLPPSPSTTLPDGSRTTALGGAAFPRTTLDGPLGSGGMWVAVLGMRDR